MQIKQHCASRDFKEKTEELPLSLNVQVTSDYCELLYETYSIYCREL